MRIFLLALAAFAFSAPAAAAQRNFTVTDFDRIRVDGGFKVVLTTNVAPFARASGSAAALDSLSLDVEGRTLIIRPSTSQWNTSRDKGPVSIEVGTHDLRSLWINGSGSLDVNRATGPSLIVAIEGTGGARVQGISVDSLKISMAGSGSLYLSGKVLSATANLLGSSSMDASQVTVRDAIISADGAAVASITATETAKVVASGPAVVTLSGKPACDVRAQGSAEVTGCRSGGS